MFQGYMSEAGASLVDTKLSLSVVPKTKVHSRDHTYMFAPSYGVLYSALKFCFWVYDFIQFFSRVHNFIRRNENLLLINT
jgi:hypothetical protein